MPSIAWSYHVRYLLWLWALVMIFVFIVLPAYYVIRDYLHHRNIKRQVEDSEFEAIVRGMTR